MPPGLKISPVAVVPQTNRRDHIILDLSFAVRVRQEIIQQAVNTTTTQTSHPHALDFLGSKMPRILNFMAHAPSGLPVYQSKYNASDGFWKMVVAAGSEWNFAYVLPQEEGQPVKLVVPNALHMGWKESPCLFCYAEGRAPRLPRQLDGSHHEPSQASHKHSQDSINIVVHMVWTTMGTAMSATQAQEACGCP